MQVLYVSNDLSIVIALNIFAADPLHKEGENAVSKYIRTKLSGKKKYSRKKVQQITTAFTGLSSKIRSRL